MSTRIVRFEPGDATSYRVLFTRLTQAEANAIGGVSEGALLFGFSTGRMRPLRVGVFQPDGYLDLGYYAQQMGRDEEPWTVRAGLLALAYLSGRDIDHTETLEQEGEWLPNWREQLAPLFRRPLLESGMEAR